MWHAVAMQQQRLAEMKITLGPPQPLRTSALRRPGAPRPPQPQPPPPPLQQCSECSGSDDDEEDDDKPAPRLTLAQRMGLVEAPEPELTTSEWDAITATSRERDASRQPCIICQEPFTTAGKQVLLSCGHTFHRQCLRSWEKHSKSRCCPVCRKLHYRKRGIDDGANLYREECVVRIQAAGRGRLARKATAKALRHLNPDRMRRYCEQRLGGLTDQLVSRLDAEHSAVDALFAEIDTSVAASRALFGGGEADDWAATEAAARQRGLGDCPVCLNPCCESEPLTLLSCSHVFHSRCLDSFERFSLKTVSTCPVCRAPHYRKRKLGQEEPEGAETSSCIEAGCRAEASAVQRGGQPPASSQPPRPPPPPPPRHASTQPGDGSHPARRRRPAAGATAQISGIGPPPPRRQLGQRPAALQALLGDS